MDYILEEYDNLLENILINGEKKETRTGLTTLSLFGRQCRYNVSERVPLLTRRRLSYKSIIAELLWFIHGSTKNQELIDFGCKYWSPWADPSNKDTLNFYNRTGFPVGYFGPTYGFNLRYFGGDYSEYVVDCHYKIGGVDQLKELIQELRTNPTSRRLVVSLWNPDVLYSMRLPPCAWSFQLNVGQGKRLDLLLNQRSADVPVGVPANIFFYTVFLYLLAQETGLRPGYLIHSIGDAHIYENQIDGVRQYLKRAKPSSPVLHIRNTYSMLGYKPFKVEDFEVENYSPCDKINIPVVV